MYREEERHIIWETEVCTTMHLSPLLLWPAPESRVFRICEGPCIITQSGTCFDIFSPFITPAASAIGILCFFFAVFTLAILQFVSERE